jgi:pyruvate-ferredoxin/flavodoxin oxidoreductase
VHEIHDLLLGAIRKVEATEQHKEQMRAQVFPLTKAVREAYRQLPAKDPKPLHEIVAEAVASTVEADSATLRHDFERMVEVLKRFQVAKTRPFFDAMEKTMAGTGGLYSVAIDPWKCTGCLECVDVCGPGALEARVQTGEVNAELGSTF